MPIVPLRLPAEQGVTWWTSPEDTSLMQDVRSSHLFWSQQ